MVFCYGSSSRQITSLSPNIYQLLFDSCAVSTSFPYSILFLSFPVTCSYPVSIHENSCVPVKQVDKRPLWMVAFPHKELHPGTPQDVPFFPVCECHCHCPAFAYVIKCIIRKMSVIHNFIWSSLQFNEVEGKSKFMPYCWWVN